MKALINFYAGISEITVNNLINFITQQIATQKPENPLDEIIIQISSSGGSSDHGLLAYNYLKQLGIKKTVIGMGNVDSAAVMIFCAGDQRLAMTGCRFTLHEALTTMQGTFNGVKLHEIGNLNERITDDYCKVISGVTSKKLSAVKKTVRQGHVMSAEEAKKYGLITDIPNKPYLESMQNINIMMINNPPLSLPTRPPAQGDQSQS
ncbi:MAG: ATP-dependent Clp protease proteolytic subunit [Minisyncoccia bacterium]